MFGAEIVAWQRRFLHIEARPDHIFAMNRSPTQPANMDPEDLRRELDDLLAQETLEHVERLTIATAIISEALRGKHLESTLVGGGAVEFYAPGSYTTSDIDLVVERLKPIDLVSAVAGALLPLGFSRSGRHWVRGDLFVEIPATSLTDPFEVYLVGPYRLRVIRKESILGERIAGFKHWRYTGFGAQAIDLISAMGDEIDEHALRDYLRREGAEDAYETLRRLAKSEEPITREILEDELDRLHLSTPEGPESK
jgi:hypothetical protein